MLVLVLVLVLLLDVVKVLLRRFLSRCSSCRPGRSTAPTWPDRATNVIGQEVQSTHVLYTVLLQG